MKKYFCKVGLTDRKTWFILCVKPIKHKPNITNEVGKMGYCVKRIREEKHMTQEELEAKSGVSRQTISAIENNRCGDVKTGTIIALAKALGTTVDAIFFVEPV